MITTIPDPETTRHIEPQSAIPFSFLWDLFFAKRPKFKLSPADLAEITAAEETVAPWRTALAVLNCCRMNPQGALHDAIDACVESPSIASAERIIARLWAPPYFSMQLNQAAAILEGKIAGMREELLPPIVRRHLVRIEKFLQQEHDAQLAADEKALSRLDGAAAGGESGAARTLRLRLEETRRQLAADPRGLCAWHAILGSYLP